MLHKHAAYDDDTPGGKCQRRGWLMDMLDRMQTGRFKFYRHLYDWFEEFRLYHRKDERVVKEGDDLMSATRYAVMMLRYARTDVPPKPRSIRSSRERVDGSVIRRPYRALSKRAGTSCPRRPATAP